MSKPQFVENKIYHIYNRGVEKREIFTEEKDYFRFIHDLFEFNDEDSALNIGYYFNPKSTEIEFQHLKSQEKKPRKLLVEIMIFTLMPNHFHLLLRQKKENGIVKFMQKLGTGYTMYFNQKYERVGSLFQGRFKAALINKEAHFIHLPFYLHTNPLTLNYGGSTSIDFLSKYRWSSYLDYIGNKNFPSLTSRNFILEFFEGEEKYKQATEKWLKEKEEEKNEEKVFENLKDIVLENY